MRMNAMLALQGQYADPVGAFARGQGARAQSDEYAHLNALRGAYKQHGGAAMQGDGNALAAIAQYDPAQAMGMRTAQHGMEIDNQRVGIARESLGIDRERLGIARQEAARLARAEAANISAEERAREFEKAKMAASGLEVVLQRGDPALFDVWKSEITTRFPDLADDLGGATLETAPVFLSILQGSAEGLMDAKPQAPLSTMGKLRNDLDNGLITPDEYAAALARMAPRGMVLETTPDGGVRFAEGVGVTDNKVPMPQLTPAGMRATIRGILEDPALALATGALAWTKNIPGTPMRRVGTRTDQLDGQAFVQAFDALKGGGAITDIEGQKATQAIGRLDTAQSTEDYKAALQELDDILAAVEARQAAVDAGTPGQTIRFRFNPATGDFE